MYAIRSYYEKYEHERPEREYHRIGDEVGDRVDEKEKAEADERDT